MQLLCPLLVLSSLLSVSANAPLKCVNTQPDGAPAEARLPANMTPLQFIKSREERMEEVRARVLSTGYGGTGGVRGARVWRNGGSVVTHGRGSFPRPSSPHATRLLNFSNYLCNSFTHLLLCFTSACTRYTPLQMNALVKRRSAPRRAAQAAQDAKASSHAVTPASLGPAPGTKCDPHTQIIAHKVCVRVSACVYLRSHVVRCACNVAHARESCKLCMCACVCVCV